MKSSKNDKIFVVVHNIRSALNVGSIFRTADAAGVSKIYLCGYTPLPQPPTPNNYPSTLDKISKTALGAEKTVPWEKHNHTWRLLGKLKKEGIQIVAIEQTPKSIIYTKFKPRFPVALVLGNEVGGLSGKILKYADKIIEIPMYGKKESLNVTVAFGIVVYQIQNSNFKF